MDWARVAKLPPGNELSTHFLRAEKILLPMYQDRTRSWLFSETVSGTVAVSETDPDSDSDSVYGHGYCH